MAHDYLIGGGWRGMEVLVLAGEFASTVRSMLMPVRRDFVPFMEPYIELTVVQEGNGYKPSMRLLWGRVPYDSRIAAISDNTSEEEDECEHLWLTMPDSTYHLLSTRNRSWLASTTAEGRPTIAPWDRRDQPILVEVEQ